MKSKFTRFPISKVSLQDRQAVPPPKDPTDLLRAAMSRGGRVSR